MEFENEEDRKALSYGVRRLPLKGEAKGGGGLAAPAFEGDGEGEDVVVADGIGDGLQFVAGGGDEHGGALHAEVGELASGRASEDEAALATEVGFAESGEMGKLQG